MSKKKADTAAKSREANELIWQRTLDLLRTKVNASDMEEWFSHFYIRQIRRNLVEIVYQGENKLSGFSMQMQLMLKICLIEVLQHDVQLKMSQELPPPPAKAAQPEENSQPFRKGPSRNLVMLCIMAAVMIGLAGPLSLIVSFFQNLSFEETFYQVGDGKVTGNLRIIHLSDLHDTVFKGNNDVLVTRIQKLKPDLIVTTGDMIDADDRSFDAAIDLCGRLTEVAPVYFVFGNNETEVVYDNPMTLESLEQILPDPDHYKADELIGTDTLTPALEKKGVVVLRDEMDTIEIRGNTIDIYGVLTSNPSAFWPFNEETYGEFLDTERSHFKLLLCHEPYIFETFEQGFWGDLILCGQTHGGIIRLPYVGGVYEHKNGLFPEMKDYTTYVAGKYRMFDHDSLIVNRGLSNRGWIRVNNRPELVIIDVTRY